LLLRTKILTTIMLGERALIAQQTMGQIPVPKNARQRTLVLYVLGEEQVLSGPWLCLDVLFERVFLCFWF